MLLRLLRRRVAGPAGLDGRGCGRNHHRQTRKQYALAGMTCGHCVGAVTQQHSGVAGVEGVDVALVAGGTSTVTVTSSGQVSDEAVAAAIYEGGYTVVTA